MKRSIGLLMLLAFFGISQSISAQARSGGAGGALTWELPPMPEWTRNLDKYDWEYVFTETAAVTSPGQVPRKVKELLDQQYGYGKDGIVWAYWPNESNIINIYQRLKGVYIWLTVSRYWFD
jgi:hypothetical protein